MLCLRDAEYSRRVQAVNKLYLTLILAITCQRPRSMQTLVVTTPCLRTGHFMSRAPTSVPSSVAKWATLSIKRSLFSCDILLCRYCSRRSECSGSNLDQQHKDACACSYQCDNACKGFCAGPGGRRHLLWSTPEDALIL